MKNKNIVAIVQARLGSSRFRKKVLKKINQTTVIENLLSRLNKSKTVKKIIVATTTSKLDDELAAFLEKINQSYYRGDEEDVLSRFYFAAKENDAEVILRITGDCPVIDPEIVDKCVDSFLETNIDYVSNIDPPTYPDGMDVEVFKFSALEKSFFEANQPFEREHVTPYIRKSGKFSKLCIKHNKDLSNIRLTIDEKEDLLVLKNVLNFFKNKEKFTLEDIEKLHNDKPEFFKPNMKHKRNEGSKIIKGQKLYKKARQIIPGGTSLLSKNPDLFLPEKWPVYFSKAKGNVVWDLEGNRYKDFSLMGVGTNILGYANKEIDTAVGKIIKKGNMSTLNCPEEVYLAEKLIELHPWSSMARFARSGGEANSIAIRIARAATGRDKVAVCGYHGWHDWYLSANLQSKKNLNEHLIAGLSPRGVPKDLIGTTIPFKYNNFEQIENIVKNNEIAAIKMEVERNEPPQNNFLEKIRNLATKNGVVLIFDECTSGFRETFGGLHKKYDVQPDIAMFGKALGNGYAITSILGTEDVMKAAETTFISSTFWTERIGPTAALETLKVMERTKSWEDITEKGKFVKKAWKEISDITGVPIKIAGIDALPTMQFISEDSLKYQTFLTQEMHKNKYLAGAGLYLSQSHSYNELEKYLTKLEKIFRTLKKFEGSNKIDDYLEGPIKLSSFSRLN